MRRGKTRTLERGLRRMAIATFFKVQWQVARRVGRKDFDGAIRVLEEALNGGAMDVHHLDLIAHCHYWAKREEMAIASAKRALDIDPKFFGAMKLLSEIYARRTDHDTAAQYVRRALEQYPQPLPATPKGFFGILRAASFLFPRLRSVAVRAREDIGNPNKNTEQWYAWAKEYLAWYDQARGESTSPTIH
jgi:tetratricopeptide (TPR) repeat protein